MARIRVNKYQLLSLIVTFILFFIPFFWFRSGEMDLGGDSSRLYYYDPFSYLQNHSLYSVSPSGLGTENIGYYTIPYVILLYFVKGIVRSPTLLISLFHGVKLSIAFLSCYLTIKEILKNKKKSSQAEIVEYSALLAGLFYIFSPSMIRGWDKAILTHDQVFLNPLMFFLLLRYFRSQQIKYLLSGLLISFVFSHNFSFSAAPPFFAFYPLSILFLLFYTRIILKQKVILRHLLFGFLAFLGLHAFHLLPQLINIFSQGTTAHDVIFSEEGKISRGLYYFSALAPNIKVSLGFLGLPQMTEINFPLPFLFLIFLLIVTLGFFWNKNKPILLTGAIFLIALFFSTANITNIGLSFYKTLFKIPGFSMFRSFYGQWGYVALFFYVLLLGQALLLIFSRIKKPYKQLLFVGLGSLLIVSSWPFINGSLINKVLWQSEDVPIVMRVDPDYETAFKVVRSLPTDGKVLTLPLTDPGYQIIAGKEGGAYEGPSTVSYLTGKKDFAGFTELGPFQNIFLEAAKAKDYQLVKKILSLLNIKYIFYNSDPYIYEEKFPEFPYQHVRNFLPREQKSYQAFIEDLDAETIFQAGRYRVYSLDNETYLPHFYVAEKTAYFESENQIVDWAIPISFYQDKKRLAISNQENKLVKPDEQLLWATKESVFLRIRKNPEKLSLPIPQPYVSRKLNSFLYPLVIIKERYELKRLTKFKEKYLEKKIFFAFKRIAELERWGREIPILRNVLQVEDLRRFWQEPQIWQIRRWGDYYSWEASFARYVSEIEEIVKMIENSNESDLWKIEAKVKVEDNLKIHQGKINEAINNAMKSDEEKIYLQTLSENVFEYLFDVAGIPVLNPLRVDYSIDVPKDLTGEYELYLEKDSISTPEQEEPLLVSIDLVGRKLENIDPQTNARWLRFKDGIRLKAGKNLPLVLNILKYENLAAESNWEGFDEVQIATDSVKVAVDNSLGILSSGIKKEIKPWLSNKHYLISFQYTTRGSAFKLKFFEREVKKDKPQISLLFEDILRSRKWRRYQAVVDSNSDAVAGLIHFFGIEGNGNSFIEMRDFFIFQIPHPEVFLKKVTARKQNASMPQITFTKINPTRHKVQVAGATTPYTLVFLDAFNKNWRLYLSESRNETQSIRGWLSRTLGSMGRKIISVFVKEEAKKGEIVTSYFEGEIKEETHKNVFLSPVSFATWGREDIMKGKHFAVNGYANAWYIEPEDVEGRTDYELMVEMITQKRFYGSFALSLIIATVSLGWLLKLMVRKNEG